MKAAVLRHPGPKNEKPLTGKSCPYRSRGRARPCCEWRRAACAGRISISRWAS